MKNILALVFSVLMTIFSYGQVRLGYTEEQLKNESPKRKYERTILPDGNKCLVATDDNFTWIYYFNHINETYLIALMPSSRELLLNILKGLNKEWIIISDTEWKTYVKGSVMLAKLIYESDFDQYTITYRLKYSLEK